MPTRERQIYDFAGTIADYVEGLRPEGFGSEEIALAMLLSMQAAVGTAVTAEIVARFAPRGTF